MLSGKKRTRLSGKNDNALGLTIEHFLGIDANSSKMPDYDGKIELKAGEQQTITFQIHKNDLSFINKQLKRVTEAGEFDLMIQNETKRIYVN